MAAFTYLNARLQSADKSSAFSSPGADDDQTILFKTKQRTVLEEWLHRLVLRSLLVHDHGVTSDGTSAACHRSETECSALPSRGSEHERESSPFVVCCRQLEKVVALIGRLHSLLIQELTFSACTLQSRALGRVQLARHSPDFDWSWNTADSATSWVNYSPSYITITTPTPGVIVSFFGGHILTINQATSFQARFLFNDSTAFEDSWGAFYIGAGNVGHWRPFCFSQMFSLPKHKRPQKLGIQLQTKSPSKTINGGAVMAAAFPLPAFLSSIRALSATGSSNQSPYSNLEHTIEVHSNKALLIMAANGRITGKELDYTCLTYTVDGVSPVGGRGKNFGQYFVTGSSTGSVFIPMGLYQLAEVSRGTHTVQLEGSGSSFDLNYVTSQITTIPISDVQLRTVTADWEIETPKGAIKSLIAAEFTTKSDSVLVVSSTFRVAGACGREVYLQFNVDREPLYASIHHTENHQWGTWHDAPGATFLRLPAPGSLFAFAQVSKGRHCVELMAFNQGPCPVTTIGAALQVGMIPEEY